MFESYPALTTAIVGAIAILGAFISVSVKSNIFLALFLAIFMIPFYLLSVFDINCTVVGGCSIWSWIKAVMILLGYIGIIIAVIAGAVSKKKETEAKK